MLRVAPFFLIQVPVMLVLALLFALAPRQRPAAPGASVFRLGIFLPYAVPSVVATLMWGYLYGRDFGPFAQLAERVARCRARTSSAAAGCSAASANIVTWEFVGYNMIILYAALRPSRTSCTRRRRSTAPARGGSPGASRSRAAAGAHAHPDVLGHRQLPAVQRAEAAADASPRASSTVPTPPTCTPTTLAFTSQQINYAAAVSFLLGLVIVVVSYAVLLTANRRRTS